MDTLTELESARRRHPDSFAPGSDAEAAALKRFADFFGDFAPGRVSRMLDATYASDVYFNDNLKAIYGSTELAKYLNDSAAGVEDCRVTIEDTTRNKDGEYLVRWKLLIRFRKFAKGRDTWTVGLTHLRLPRTAAWLTTRTTGIPRSASISTSPCWARRSARSGAGSDRAAQTA